MNPASPLVTVLLPVHNGAAFLREAVDSLLRQTLGDFEILAIDDASTDATADILRGWGDPRIRLLGGRDRLGLVGALNLGLDHARGTFIARMDADDVALPDRLASQVALLQSRPDVGLCGGLARSFGLRKGLFFRPPMDHDEIRAYLPFDSPLVHPTVLFRRLLVDQGHFRYDPGFTLSEDYELWSRLARVTRLANLDRVVLEYRVHASGVTQSQWGVMDTHAVRVAARELEGMGVEADAETLRFHRNLGRGHCFEIDREEDLVRAEGWLSFLVSANARSGYVPVQAFRRIVAGVWFGACYHAGTLRGTLLRRYVRSPLRRGRSTRPVEWLALVRSAFRGGQRP